MNDHRAIGARLWVIVVALGFGLTTARAEQANAIADNFPGTAFETITPEAAGWSAEQLAAAKSWSLQIAPAAAVMIVQHGRVVAEWGDTATKSNLHSIRKSLLSALYGNAVEKHLIDPTATIGSLGIDDNDPGLTEIEKTATVVDLLKARSGVYHAALYETPGMAKRRPARGSHPPGTFWYYNNWDFNALGTIYEQATKQSIFDAFDQQIAHPIGMQDYVASDGQYVSGKESEHRAYPIRMSARDLARFALLYLHEGRWKDRQLVPASWVRESTQAYSQAYTDAGPGLGYAYLWWTGFITEMGAPVVKMPPGSFEGIGYEGQWAFVIPALDLVIIHRINSDFPHKREPDFRQMGRLLWLILTAAGDKDAGPDISLAHATGQRLDGEALKAALSGKTLVFGRNLERGPRAWPTRADGTTSVLVGPEREERFTGTWRIDDRSRYCRTLNDPTDSAEHCFVVVVNGATVKLFDGEGLMRFDMRAE
ncbi:serine hydrolase [Bradyrhizobium jicamae]|uniref:serine hydrolase domain-containing protein n=1 Tax=Bradyrhizobium jicamae TaxID=280332 RepID=UPI001BAE08D4|nr:serine hydrolase [Bradyrhizobium jicamae]MBR0752430.1 serine hydrolase [Bradyrhizobium jicamae]